MGADMMPMKYMMPMTFYNNLCVRLLWQPFDSCEDATDVTKGGNDVYIPMLIFVAFLGFMV